MRREEKNVIINSLADQLKEFPHFYLADISGLNAEDTAAIRRQCFEKEIKLIVVKNTLLRKALEQIEFQGTELFDVLKGSTSIMLTAQNNVPAKLIKEFSKKNKLKKPVLKGAFVEDTTYIGEATLEELVTSSLRKSLLAISLAYCNLQRRMLFLRCNQAEIFYRVLLRPYQREKNKKFSQNFFKNEVKWQILRNLQKNWLICL